MKSLAEVIGITPEPWRYEHGDPEFYEGRHFVAWEGTEDDQSIICESTYGEANARAIAAVPKLLETIFKQCHDWEGQARYEDRGNYRQNPAYDDLKRFSKVLEETTGLTYEEIKRRMEV
ncbi:MAG: hypothetical protein PHQ35_11080 [Phycisphaerae bacterium]|nr:hypothetical protein [Phycisphaerae bacterium]